jgi:hypothetical protein
VNTHTRIDCRRVVALLLLLCWTTWTEGTSERQFSCRQLLAFTAGVAVTLAVVIPPIQYGDRTIDEHLRLREVHYDFNHRTTLQTFQKDDFSAVGAAYMHRVSSRVNDGLFPFSADYPLHQESQLVHFYRLLSQADGDLSGRIQQEMKKLGVPGVLGQPVESREFAEFREHFLGGWSIWEPRATFFLQSVEPRKQMGELLGIALEHHWEGFGPAAAVPGPGSYLDDFLEQVENSVD